MCIAIIKHMERLAKKENIQKIYLGLLSIKCGENILATKLTLWASHLWWHFHDKVTTFLGCCFEAFARSIVLRFWRYILATKLTLWTSPLWWHFHDKVTIFLGYCFHRFVPCDDIFMTKLQLSLDIASKESCVMEMSSYVV